MAMARKLIPILVLALLAALPAAAQAVPAAGLRRGLAAERRQRQGLRADAGSGDRAACGCRSYWTAVQPQSPAFSEPDWGGFDHEVELAAEAGIRIMPFVWGSPGMGGRRR